jgi:hypothetical protein
MKKGFIKITRGRIFAHTTIINLFDPLENMVSIKYLSESLQKKKNTKREFKLKCSNLSGFLDPFLRKILNAPFHGKHSGT